MTKVLVIDDDSMVRLLILEGYQVIEAAYGQAGYAAAISDSPNIILLDLNMAIMDGFQVLHKLKNNPETVRIPVIVLTARIDAESERRCMAAGATDYIKKPWGPAELQERIAIIVGVRDRSVRDTSHKRQSRTSWEIWSSRQDYLSLPRNDSFWQ